MFHCDNCGREGNIDDIVEMNIGEFCPCCYNKIEEGDWYDT